MRAASIARLPTWLPFIAFGPLQVCVGILTIGLAQRLHLSQIVALGIFAVMLLAGVGSVLCWFWAVGRVMNSALGPEARWPTRWFDGACAYVGGYALVFIAWSLSVWPGSPVPAPPWVVILVLHSAAMLAMLAILIWVTRAVVVKCYVKPGIADAIATFCLLWFYLLGVWFIHPRAKTAARELEQHES